VFDLVPHSPGLTYVGRLDVMTSGLLLLTNDGQAAHRLMHPRFAVERTYRAVVHGRPEREIQRLLAQKTVIEGRAVNLRRFELRPDRSGATELLLVLAEGRYRIVRRLCERLGLKVDRLVRLSYGPIRLGRLGAGHWRYLARPELAAIAQLKAA
jgi:23S rRNA pseudouridine2605 synthase